MQTLMHGAKKTVAMLQRLESYGLKDPLEKLIKANRLGTDLSTRENLSEEAQTALRAVWACLPGGYRKPTLAYYGL